MITSHLKFGLDKLKLRIENESRSTQNNDYQYFDFEYLEDIMEKNIHFDEKIHRFDELSDK